MSGEFTNDIRLASLERSRDAALRKAESDFQVAVAAGGNATTLQATRDATIATTHASHTVAVSKLVLPANSGNAGKSGKT